MTDSVARVYLLLTVYNRKTETLRALNYFRATIPEITIIMNDDSPNAFLYSDLDCWNQFTRLKSSEKYWNRGMISAYEFMINNCNPRESDIVICINNDIEILDLDVLQLHANDVFIGKFHDGKRSKTYGLRRIFSNFHPIASWIRKVDHVTFNMNFASFRYDILKKYGFLDPYFHHGFGDYELGSRLSLKGVSIKESDDFLGVCDRNPVTNTSLDKGLSLRERLTLFHSVKEGVFSEKVYFLYKVYGFPGFFILIRQYLNVIF